MLSGYDELLVLEKIDFLKFFDRDGFELDSLLLTRRILAENLNSLLSSESLFSNVLLIEFIRLITVCLLDFSLKIKI